MKMRVFLFALLFTTEIFAAAPSVQIAFIEDTDLLPTSPFSERVEVFPSTVAVTDSDEKKPGYGIMVASVLVGQNSFLPNQLKVTAVPNFESFSAFQETQSPDDLVLLSLQRTQGYPGMPPELERELTSIVEIFKGCIGEEDKRQNLIESCQENLEILPEGSLLRSTIAMMQGYLECANGMKSETVGTEFLTQELTQAWVHNLEMSVEKVRQEGSQKARRSFDSMKAALVNGVAQHPNTLIMMALDNEPGCIDPFYAELFEGNNLLDHTILVSGTMGTIIQSAHTEAYANHARVKPIRVGGVYNPETKEYEYMEGTSFGTSLLALDAYAEAISGNMSFDTLKSALLSKVKRYNTYDVIEIEEISGSAGSDSE